ncbi:hypothetical protein [Quisquiliibacterium transsilvanicum]|uniref:DUF2514 family protein n=1 Tax=Quisquiliibacterium transsilvanicum TaxID=1549638 RepID=A0A7W8HH29_9BURK|nr:hypothetical protein [Quisquiliibacterium transsilvanicum]MBB5271326.1 hypothetical protein [Quisquiliibacterium transsilvanicum]
MTLQSLGIIALVVALAVGGFGVHRAGVKSGEARIQAQWDAERLAHAEAVQRAQRDKEAAERDLAIRLQESADAHTVTLDRLRDAESAAGRAQLRLRAAIATAALGAREQSQVAAAGPATDDRAAAAGELLAACAGELEQMGAAAGGLAAQVIGLQGYARTAYEAAQESPHGND